MLQVMKKPQSLCGHPRIVYPTSSDSLFIAYTDGFNMDTGVQLYQHQKRELFKMPANQILLFSQQVMICRHSISQLVNLTTKLI